MALNIKKAISKYGLTSIEVAKRMGINRVGLSYHINGNPSVEILNRIATAIGCDVSELFEQTKSNQITCPHCGKPLSIEIK